MKKTLSIDEAFETLVSQSSLEGGEDCVTYYLHVTADGHTVGFAADADRTFTFKIPIGDEDWYFHSTRRADREKELDEIWKTSVEEEEHELAAQLRFRRETEELEEPYCMDDYYSKERRDDPDFMAIVEDLCRQANAWLAEQP